MPVRFTHTVLADPERVHRQVFQRGPVLHAGQAGRPDRDTDRRALRFDGELVRIVEVPAIFLSVVSRRILAKSAAGRS